MRRQNSLDRAWRLSGGGPAIRARSSATSSPVKSRPQSRHSIRPLVAAPSGRVCARRVLPSLHPRDSRLRVVRTHPPRRCRCRRCSDAPVAAARVGRFRRTLRRPPARVRVASRQVPERERRADPEGVPGPECRPAQHRQGTGRLRPGCGEGFGSPHSRGHAGRVASGVAAERRRDPFQPVSGSRYGCA